MENNNSEQQHTIFLHIASWFDESPYLKENLEGQVAALLNRAYRSNPSGS